MALNKNDENLLDELVTKTKRHRLFSVILFIGICVISLASFTNAIEDLSSLFKKPNKPEEPQTPVITTTPSSTTTIVNGGNDFKIIKSGISPAPERSQCSGIKEKSASNKLNISVHRGDNTYCSHSVTASFVANNSKYPKDQFLKYSVEVNIKNALRLTRNDGGNVRLVKKQGGAAIYNSQNDGDKYEVKLKNMNTYFFYVHAITDKRLSENTNISLTFRRLTN